MAPGAHCQRPTALAPTRRHLRWREHMATGATSSALPPRCPAGLQLTPVQLGGASSTGGRPRLLGAPVSPPARAARLVCQPAAAAEQRGGRLAADVAVCGHAWRPARRPSRAHRHVGPCHHAASAGGVTTLMGPLHAPSAEKLTQVARRTQTRLSTSSAHTRRMLQGRQLPYTGAHLLHGMLAAPRARASRRSAAPAWRRARRGWQRRGCLAVQIAAQVRQRPPVALCPVRSAARAGSARQNARCKAPACRSVSWPGIHIRR